MAFEKHRQLPLGVRLLLLIYEMALYPAAEIFRLVATLVPSLKPQLQGRKLDVDSLVACSARRHDKEKCALFYISSAGEYEQAKPIIDRLKQSSGFYVYLVFHSRSGFLHARALGEDADYQMSPLDTFRNWRKVFVQLRPDIVVLVRDEFWPNFLAASYCFSQLVVTELTYAKCSTLNLFVKGRLLKFADSLYAVTKEAKVLYGAQGLNDIIISGETKFDRSAERFAQNKAKILALRERMEECFGRATRIVVGSAWKADIRMALDALEVLKVKNLNQLPIQLVIVPHKVNDQMLMWMKNECQTRGFKYSVVRNSKFSKNLDVSVILVNELGHLFNYYGCGDANFVGGGFVKERVHNMLEAAVHLKPIFMGPRIDLQTESRPLIDRGLATIIGSADDIVTIMSDSRAWQQHCETVGGQFVAENCGAADFIVKHLLVMRPLKGNSYEKSLSYLPSIR